MSFYVKKLIGNARIPVRGSDHAAGYDLTAIENVIVRAGGKEVIPTGLAIRCPPGTYARIAPRSGLAIKNHISVGAGVVDADFRGEVKVVLFNHSPTEDFIVKPGDRIAQLILEVIITPPVQEVDELDDTVRGSHGFGSTGLQ